MNFERLKFGHGCGKKIRTTRDKICFTKRRRVWCRCSVIRSGGQIYKTKFSDLKLRKKLCTVLRSYCNLCFTTWEGYNRLGRIVRMYLMPFGELQLHRFTRRMNIFYFMIFGYFMFFWKFLTFNIFMFFMTFKIFSWFFSITSLIKLRTLFCFSFTEKLLNILFDLKMLGGIIIDISASKYFLLKFDYYFFRKNENDRSRIKTVFDTKKQK